MVENSEVKFKPFLKLPFAKQLYRITEGWYYSKAESSISGFISHASVDYELPRGTPVLAAAEGWAIASYWSFPIIDEKGHPKLYQGKPIRTGFGRFVQIYHPKQHLYTLYAHLDKVSDQIPFHRPRRSGGKFYPVGHKLDPDKFAKYYLAKWVKEGEVIGFVGDTGVGWGYIDWPIRPSPRKYPAWDEIHLHFEVFIRFGSKRQKKRYFDPYGLKGRGRSYPDSYKKGRPIGAKGVVLWKIGQDKLPEFVKP